MEKPPHIATIKWQKARASRLRLDFIG